MEENTNHCSFYRLLLNNGSIGVTRTSMCFASQVYVLAFNGSLNTIYSPREFAMFFSQGPRSKFLSGGGGGGGQGAKLDEIFVGGGCLGIFI